MRCEASRLAFADRRALRRPAVLAALHKRGSTRGHLVVVKGFSTHGGRRVLVVDRRQLCPSDRACEGELDEAARLTYDEYVSGWSGFAHWVDFYRIKRR